MVSLKKVANNVLESSQQTNIFSKSTIETLERSVKYSQKERTCETWKNVFYFTSKALFVLEKITF